MAPGLVEWVDVRSSQDVNRGPSLLQQAGWVINPPEQAVLDFPVWGSAKLAGIARRRMSVVFMLRVVVEI